MQLLIYIVVRLFRHMGMEKKKKEHAKEEQAYINRQRPDKYLMLSYQDPIMLQFHPRLEWDQVSAQAFHVHDQPTSFLCGQNWMS